MSFRDMQKNVFSASKNALPKATAWSDISELVSPIHADDIPDFIHWVHFNGVTNEHGGYDFSAYLTKNNYFSLGLPPKTPVRAIADGIISGTLIHQDAPYKNTMYVLHTQNDSSENPSGSRDLRSLYSHIIPRKNFGVVHAGEIIADVYHCESVSSEMLTHVHVSMYGQDGYYDDPAKFLPGLSESVPRSPLSFSFENKTLNALPVRLRNRVRVSTVYGGNIVDFVDDNPLFDL